MQWRRTKKIWEKKKKKKTWWHPKRSESTRKWVKAVFLKKRQNGEMTFYHKIKAYGTIDDSARSDNYTNSREVW